MEIVEQLRQVCSVAVDTDIFQGRYFQGCSFRGISVVLNEVQSFTMNQVFRCRL